MEISSFSLPPDGGSFEPPSEGGLPGSAPLNFGTEHYFTHPERPEGAVDIIGVPQIDCTAL
jgi:hypothetical protein